MRIVLKPAGTLILLVVIAVLCFFAFNNAGLFFGGRPNAAEASVEPTTSTVRFRPLDLSRIGKSDWVQFGAAPKDGTAEIKSVEKSAVRKNIPTRRIGSLEFVGREAVEYDGDARAFKWIDGDQNAPTATESRSGLRVDGVGNGFRFKITPEIGKRYQLKVWVGGAGVRSKLMARMSDGSPLSSSDESVQGVGGGEFRSLYTVVFEANKPGQELICSYLVAASREGGSVSIQAIALD